MQNRVQARYYNIGERKEGKYLVQTKLQARSSCITLPEVHDIVKGIDPNILLEKQVTQIKPRLGQDSKGIKKNKLPISQLLNKPIIPLTEK